MKKGREEGKGTCSIALRGNRRPCLHLRDIAEEVFKVNGQDRVYTTV